MAITAALIVYRLIERPTTDVLRRRSVGLRDDSPRRHLILPREQVHMPKALDGALHYHNLADSFKQVQS